MKQFKTNFPDNKRIVDAFSHCQYLIIYYISESRKKFHSEKKRVLALFIDFLLLIIISNLVIIKIITNSYLKCPVEPSTGHFYFKLLLKTPIKNGDYYGKYYL